MQVIQEYPPISLSNKIGSIFIKLFECQIEEVISHCDESYLGFYSSKQAFAEEFWGELAEAKMLDDPDQSIEDFTSEIFDLLYKYQDGHVFCDNW